jgi:hypothetical protein
MFDLDTGVEDRGDVNRPAGGGNLICGDGY